MTIDAQAIAAAVCTATAALILNTKLALYNVAAGKPCPAVRLQ